MWCFLLQNNQPYSKLGSKTSLQFYEIYIPYSCKIMPNRTHATTYLLLNVLLEKNYRLLSPVFWRCAFTVALVISVWEPWVSISHCIRDVSQLAFLTSWVLRDAEQPTVVWEAWLIVISSAVSTVEAFMSTSIFKPDIVGSKEWANLFVICFWFWNCMSVHCCNSQWVRFIFN